jgi:hypothetical protein
MTVTFATHHQLICDDLGHRCTDGHLQPTLGQQNLQQQQQQQQPKRLSSSLQHTTLG